MKLLLVEDEVGIREALAMFLQLVGHEVDAVADVESARSTLDNSEYDVVISDWQLPDGTAEDVLCRAGKAWRLVVSGHGDLLEGRSRAQRILKKPLHPKMLAELLEEHEREIAPPAQKDVSLAPEVLAARDAFRVCCAPGTFESSDDGYLIRFEGEVVEPGLLSQLSKDIGGDLRMYDDGDVVFGNWRLRCDGAPDGATRVRPGELVELPELGEGDRVHIDATDERLTVESFDTMVAEIERLERCGVVASIGSMPRSWFDLLLAWGEWQKLPMRSRTGPDLPAELSILWDDDGTIERDGRDARRSSRTALARS